MLAQHVDIGLGNCVRIEGAVRLVGRVGVSRAAHSAINNEMGDVNALGPQLARRALRQSAQRKLPHGEGREERESFDARGRSGEQDGAPRAGHHALCGLLGDEEAAKGSDGDCLLHRGRIEVGARASIAQLYCKGAQFDQGDGEKILADAMSIYGKKTVSEPERHASHPVYQRDTY